MDNKPEMTHAEKIQKIRLWQTAEMMRPMTCGKDSQNHPPLEPEEVDGEVRLKCTACDYRQKHVPSIIYGINSKEFLDEMEELRVMLAKARGETP